MRNLKWVLLGVFLTGEAVLALYNPGAVLGGLLAFTLPLLIFWPPAVKAAMLRQLNAEAKVATLPHEEWPTHDAETVNRLTRELEELGFQFASDEVWEVKAAKSATNHVRSLVHEGHRCLGRVQVMVLANGRASKPVCVIESYFGAEGNLQAESGPAVPSVPPIADPSHVVPPRNSTTRHIPKLEGYNYSTRGTKSSLSTNLLLHSQVLITNLKDASPAELLTRHLERRAEVAALLGMEPQDGDLMAIHRAFHLRCWPNFAIPLARRNPWGNLATAIWRGRTQREWLGDLAKER